MGKTKLIITIGFLAYLAVVFFMLYNIDKRLLAIFCVLGSALYVGLIRRFQNE